MSSPLTSVDDKPGFFQRIAAAIGAFFSFVFQLGLIAGIAAGAFLAITSIHVAAALNDPVQQIDHEKVSVVTMAATVTQGFTIERRYTGLVEAAVATDLAFEVVGRVSDVRVEIGDRVAAGDVLASLDTRRLDAQRRETVARLEQSRAGLALAQEQETRAQQLLAENAASQARVDEAVAALRTAEGDVASLEAQLATVEADIADAVLRAPFNGAVVDESLSVGDFVAAGQGVVELVQLSSAQARIGVPLDVADRLSVGERVTLDWRGRRIDGFVKGVAPLLGSGSRTATLIAALPEEISPLSGETLGLVTEQRVEGENIRVPLGALVADLRGLFAVQVAERSASGELVIVRSPVQVLYTDGQFAFVSGTLEEGDEVVVRGTNRVSPGQSVRLARADQESRP